MLSFEPNIVFIDDKRDEVIDLVEMYRQEGIGCKFYNADISDGDDKPTKRYVDVNLIFLDLYYKAEFDVELCTGWVESLIEENSFYILVIWSKDTHHRPEIEEDLISLNRKPYIIFDFQKGEHYKTEDNKWDFDKLYCDIEDKVKECHTLEELGLWKKSIKNSSNAIVGHLAKDVESSDLLTQKLQKIIVGHGGTYYISNDNQEQKREILFEALDNVLISNAKSTRPSSVISPANSTTLYTIDGRVQAEIDSKLNSWFHFNVFNNIEDDFIVSGLISINQDDELKRLYSIIDDPKLAPKLTQQISSETTILTDIVVVLTRPCDIAQNKFGKNVKLLSGIKITNPDRYIDSDLTSRQKRHLNKIKFNLEELPDSCKLYDHLYFSESENDIAMIFDFRYSFSVPENIFYENFENIKIFNKELISEIQVEYSSYSSRLGITQII